MVPLFLSFAFFVVAVFGSVNNADTNLVGDAYMKSHYAPYTVSATCTGHFGQYFSLPTGPSGYSVVQAVATLDNKTDLNAFIYANDAESQISYLGGGIWPGQYITPTATYMHYPSWNACFIISGWSFSYEQFRKSSAHYVESQSERYATYFGSVGDPGNGPRNIAFHAVVDTHTKTPTFVSYSQVAPKYVLQEPGNPMYVDGQVEFEHCTLGKPNPSLIALPDACKSPFLVPYFCPGDAAFAPCAYAPFYFDNEYVQNPYNFSGSTKRSVVPSNGSVNNVEKLKTMVEQYLKGPNYAW